MTIPTNFDNGLQIDDFMVPAFATIVVSAEDTNVVTVTIQLYADAAGTIELDNEAAVFLYLSDSSAGAGIAASAPSGGITAGTDGDYVALVTGIAGFLISETDGDIDFTITETGTDTFYPVLVLPTGRRIVGAAATFAA